MSQDLEWSEAFCSQYIAGAGLREPSTKMKFPRAVEELVAKLREVREEGRKEAKREE